jgi:hypothetical protein
MANQQNQFEDLITDLIYIRKDVGFVPDRVFKNAGVFLKVIGGKQQSFETIKTRLVSAIDSLPNRQDAEALSVAFALLPEYESIGSLTDRRKKYGGQIGRKIDTLMDRENAAINELVIQLYTARYTTSPMPHDTPIMHSAAIHERIEITALVIDHLWTETREHYRLIPLMDGAEYLEVSSDIPAKISPTCDCIVSIETTNGGLRHRFNYAEPLLRGMPTELDFIMRPDGTHDDELILIEETRAFHEPTLSCSVEIVFMGDKPKRIWQYKQLPLYERPGIPTKQQLLELNGGSAVKAEFTDLYGGLFSGIAWEW